MDKNIDYLYVGHNGHEPKQYGSDGEYLCCKECGDDWPCQEVYRQLSKIVNDLPSFLSGRSGESSNVPYPELEGKELLLQEMQDSPSFNRFIHKLCDMLFNAAYGKDYTKSAQMIDLVWRQYVDRIQFYHDQFQERNTWLAYELDAFTKNVRNNAKLSALLNDQRFLQPLLSFHITDVIRPSLSKKLLTPLHLFANRNPKK